MMLHPATQEALKRLKSWGVTVLETGSGRLACGDVGPGKLLDPDEIAVIIHRKLHPETGTERRLRKVLITSGGTRERIDEARELSNISTGRTGAVVADHFISKNWDVSFLHASHAEIPGGRCQKIGFTDFQSLDDTLHHLLQENVYHAVIHLAAVSDYSVESIYVNDEEFKAPLTGKIDSQSGEITIRLRRNHKILNRIKKYAGNNQLVLVAFKFTAGADEKAAREMVASMKQESGADLVVWNDAGSRISGKQTNYHIFTGHGPVTDDCPEAVNLAARLEEILSEKIKTD